MRQPGSSFKPLAWAGLFATRKYVPSTTVLDEELTRPDSGSPSGKYHPMNYDGKFHGTVTLRSALANSYNIPAVLVQETIGTKELIRIAQALGVRTALPEVQSLVLGAGAVGAGLGIGLNLPLGMGMWLVFMTVMFGSRMPIRQGRPFAEKP